MKSLEALKNINYKDINHYYVLCGRLRIYRDIFTGRRNLVNLLFAAVAGATLSALAALCSVRNHDWIICG